MRSFNFLKISIVIAIFSVGIFAQEYSGKLVELNGQKVTNSKAFIDLKFRTGGMTGNAGCNRMFGSFSARGNSIKFSEIGTTRMFCTKPAGVMKQEAAVTRALGEATRYQIRGGTLRIYAGRRQLLRFERAYDTVTGGPAIPVDVNSPGLEDRKWVLDRKYSGIPVDSAGAPFINFTRAVKPGPLGVTTRGSAGGNTGCNVFGGSYSVTGGKIGISEVISTMRACIEDDRMNTERTFLDGLRKANRFEIIREELSLYENSTLLLRFYGRSK
jgi:heat shock protein HslJ